jgi:hypothetical protein
MLDDNNPEIAVIASKDDHGISPANSGEAALLGRKVLGLGYRLGKDGEESRQLDISTP